MTQQLFYSLVTFNKEIHLIEIKNVFYKSTKTEIGSNNGYKQQKTEHTM